MTIIVIAGVCGSGNTNGLTVAHLISNFIRTTIGKRLAADFADADDYHPIENKDLMKNGIGLNDQQRLPWLEKLHCLLSDWTNNGTNGILSCSALKAKYRQILNNGANKNRAMSNVSVKYILLFLSYDSVCERLKSRSHEFIKDTSILKGQFEILEYGSDSDLSTMFTHIIDCENKSIDDVVDELKWIVKSGY